MLSERLEVRIDEETMERLRVEAERRDLSVGELVRQAVQEFFEGNRRRRLEAAERLCGLEVDWPTKDWPAIEEDYLAELDADLP